MEKEIATAFTPAATQLAAHVVLTKEDTDRLFNALAEPFYPSVVKWVVKATAEHKEGNRRGLVAAYADPRAYSDRLNELFTPLGWTQEYSMHVVQDFQRKNGGKETCASAKVMVICRVTIFGLNSHSGTGENWADNENALTSADAQAFKRACSCFGLGRYLYSLPQVWVELDEFKRPARLPELPAWALPEGHKKQKAPRGTNGAGPEQDTRPASANGNGHEMDRTGAATNGTSRSGSSENRIKDFRQHLMEIQQLSKSVGRKLFANVLKTSAGVESVTEVHEVGKLKLILERLQNVQRGIQRLKAAVGKVGLEALREECEKLKLPGVSTDDIPDNKALHDLIERLEDRARTAKEDFPHAAVASTNRQPQQVPPSQNESVSSQVVHLRNELLSRARRLASERKQSIESVVAWASEGSLEYGKLSQLAETDLSKVKAALQKLI